MPGTNIREKTAQVTRTLPIQVGTGFLAGETEKGPVDRAVLCRSDQEFEDNFGGEVAFSTARQEVRRFFSGGGSRLYFARIIGDGALTADVDLLDNDAEIALTATAVGPGTWANAYNLDVVAGDAGGFRLLLTHDTDGDVNDLSPSFATRDAAIAWAASNVAVNNGIYTLTMGAGDEAPDPGIGAQPFAGGAQGAAIVGDDAQAALDLFLKKYGPGQVSFIGRFDAADRVMLADHAFNNRRVAILPIERTTDKATLAGIGEQIKAMDNGRKGAGFAPWIQVAHRTPGVAPITMSPVTSVMARIAVNDAAGILANEPTAGDLGNLPGVIGLDGDLEPDMDDLTEAGINSIIDDDGTYKIYGYRSGADKVTQPLHWQFGNSRLYMQIAAGADQILKRFVLRRVDGQRRIFGKLEGQLSTFLVPFHTAGALYGAEANDSFYVDVDSVNTPETIADGQINAAIELTMSSMGETVTLDIYRRAIA